MPLAASQRGTLRCSFLLATRPSPSGPPSTSASPTTSSLPRESSANRSSLASGLSLVSHLSSRWSSTQRSVSGSQDWFDPYSRLNSPRTHRPIPTSSLLAPSTFSSRSSPGAARRRAHDRGSTRRWTRGRESLNVDPVPRATLASLAASRRLIHRMCRPRSRRLPFSSRRPP